MERTRRKNSMCAWIAAALAVALASIIAPVAVAATGSATPVVRGARALGADRAAAILTAAGWRPERPTAGLDRLEEAYLREGFLQARVGTVRDRSDSTWAVVVDEGERAHYGSVRVEGSTLLSADEVMEALGVAPGLPYTPQRLPGRIAKVLQRYDDAGFPFAQVRVDSLAFDQTHNTVAVNLFVLEGSARTIEHVVVEGLAKTRPELVERMSGIETGTPYRARMLRDAYLRLSASGVFNEVEYPTVRLSSDGRGVDAVLTVDETRRSHTFTSALGYSAEQGTSRREISGLAQLELNNIGGTLRNLGVLWNNDGKSRIETRIDYRDQFFLSRPLAVGVTLHQVGLDTVYTWQSVGVDVERPAGRVGGALVGVSLGVHGDRNVFSVGDLLRSWRVRTSAGMRYLRGGRRASLNVAATFTLARKRRVPREGPTESLNQYITEVETRAGARLRPIVRLRSTLVYRGLESDEPTVPLSELFYVGGARTLRGYKENQFPGRRVATAQTEVLFGASTTENLYLFTDVGYILQETLTPAGTADRNELVRAGYGFGLRTVSRLGNVDLSFGVGEKLSLRQTKVHVLLEQNF